MSLTGAALIGGKCLYGLLSDRRGAPVANAVFYGASAAGLLLCCLGGTSPVRMFSSLLFSGVGFSMVGLGIGSQPIVGYNYGAKNFARVKKTYLRTILVGTIVASVGCACFQLFPQAIVSIFGQGSALYNQFAVLCFRRFLCTVFLLGLIIPSGIFFQSIGKPVKAIISTM